MHFVQMDLFNYLRLIMYTDLTLTGILNQQWLTLGVKGMQALVQLGFALQ